MSVITREATANESPDTTNGIGGDVAVSSPTNTGHALTIAVGVNTIVDKTCRWHTFQNLLVGNRTSVKLKVTHTSDGSLLGPSAGNDFNLAYTLNNGGAWTTIVSRQNVDDSSQQGPTVAEVSLPLNQDLTQVQVRDLVEGVSLDPGDTGRMDVTISNIKIEVTIADPTFLD